MGSSKEDKEPVQEDSTPAKENNRSVPGILSPLTGSIEENRITHEEDRRSDKENAEAGKEKIIQLHRQDNVVVCIRPLQAGEKFFISGEEVVAREPVPTGHKLAGRTIKTGETIIKYGVPIGTATQTIFPGELVHTHNIKSNYIATYLIE